MTIRVKVIADSEAPNKCRLTTLECYYPRFIHAEVGTHRALSRNSSSSRAIPVETMIQSIIDDPAMPVHWGKNQKGMSAAEEVSQEDQELAKMHWLLARDSAIAYVRQLCEIGIHKQIANRILEPWLHIKTLISATDWDNFFHLRTHKDAQPEFQTLANEMYKCLYDDFSGSVPVKIDMGDWHLPYIKDEERQVYSKEQLVKVSTARCARTSYRLVDGSESSFEKDLELHDKLAASVPKHLSPTEHPSTPLNGSFMRVGNFQGWKQYRKMIHGENYVRP